MTYKRKTGVLFAILAAALYAINSPISKLLLQKIQPTMMASLLYLGAGTGLFIVGIIQRKSGRTIKEKPLTKKELPFTTAMVLLDIAAPILLMFGLKTTTAANASLLNNFEIVATAILALVFFKETISKKLWVAIALVTLSSIILTFKDFSSFSFSWGSFLVLAACACWGLENNCTRMLSSKDPLQIVVIKGFGSGFGSLLIAFILGEYVKSVFYILAALVLGFVAYGLSIFFYIYAQRELGAAKTSTYYALAPFMGAGLSLIIFREVPSGSFFIALIVMFAGTYFATKDNQKQ